MKINIAELSKNNIESTTNTVKMRLSEHAQSMVFQLFTKNVYSNPIGTVVREITSNCFDSHIEANVNSPVIIKKTYDKQTNTHYISFIDYGVGMSTDRVNNIYGVYFESTKRTDNEQIGGFGVGAKSVLAYKRSTGQGEGEYDNSFYVITNFDNVKYYYCIYEGTDTPVISLLHQEETKERNGTEVRIPVLEKDLSNFSKEMVRQLYYFENVIFEGFDESTTYYSHYSELLTNKYQIVRGKNFLFRGTDYNENIHICLGRVAYPIDYNVLGLNSSDYRLPVALKLEVGEINVTVSRESIDYSESTIKMLRKKLEEVKKEIADMLVKQYEGIVTLEQYFNLKNDFGRLNFGNGLSMYVGNLIKQSDISLSNFSYNILKMPNDKQLFRFFFKVKTMGKKPTGRRSRYNTSSYEFDGGYQELQKHNNLLYITDVFNRKVLKQAYLKHTFELYHIISEINLCTHPEILSDIYDLFSVNLKSVIDEKTGKVDSFIQTLIDMQKEYFTIVQAHAQDYDLLIVPEDFIEERKDRKSKITEEMRKLTIPVKFIEHYGRDRVELSMLFDTRMQIFYGTQEDETKLSRASQIFSLLFDDSLIVNGVNYDKTFTKRSDCYDQKKKKNPNAGIMFIMLAHNNVKYMEYCHNANHINTVYDKLLYRKESIVKQYFQTYNTIEQYNSILELYKSKHFAKIDKKWGKKIDDLNAKIKAIPAKAKDNNIGNNRPLLGNYYKLNDIKPTKEQIVINKQIDEIKKLQALNTNVLRWVSMPYSFDKEHTELYKILGKIMVL